MFYDIATLTVRLGTAGKVLAGVDAWSKAAESKARLLGAWNAELGQLNQFLLLREYTDIEALLAERQRTLETTDPFGAGESIVEMNFDSYKPFPWSTPLESGKYGNVYEIRTYKLKHGGVAPTQAAWQQAMIERGKLSPLALVLHSIDGAPRFTHIWPFADLNERAAVRAKSVELGIWPPKGGPDWLTGDMRSTIALPTAISPLA